MTVVLTSAPLSMLTMPTAPLSLPMPIPPPVALTVAALRTFSVPVPLLPMSKNVVVHCEPAPVMVTVPLALLAFVPM